MQKGEKCRVEKVGASQQMREAMDGVVDAGHGINNGEYFNFNGNNVDL